MMQHSPILKMLGMATWVITALYSINILTCYCGYDTCGWMMDMMPGMTVPLIWIIGISGIISLAMFVKATFMCCSGCGSCPCNCNK